MTSPVQQYYHVCGHCTAKWFAALPVDNCPRCGGEPGPVVAAQPPWSRRASSGECKHGPHCGSLKTAIELLKGIPEAHRFQIVLAALRGRFPFESVVTRQLSAVICSCWSEVRESSWPETMPIALQSPLRHSTQRCVQRLVLQPHRQSLRKLLAHLDKRCSNERLVTVGRVRREVCRILRHTAGKHRLVIDPNGWACADGLLKVINQRSLELQLWRDWRYADLQRQAALHAGERISLTIGAIRACYGHSIPDVCAGDRLVPPSVLFHGTSREFFPAILQHGLVPGDRTLLHLTSDIHYARKVASKHPSPVVLIIDAEQAARHATVFWKCNSHVWQCTQIAPEFIMAHAGSRGAIHAFTTQSPIVPDIRKEKGC